MSADTNNLNYESIAQVIDEFMLILRDNKNFDARDTVLGELTAAEDNYGDLGKTYIFRNKSLPFLEIRITTTSDPLNYSDDRHSVPIVPGRAELWIHNMSIEIDKAALERRLNLEGYWVDANGLKRQGNDIGNDPPPTTAWHRYRYRANPNESGGFPVEVELTYTDSPNASRLHRPVLSIVTIQRDYPILTPQQRKQKRDEEREKKREKYGYMNLCTGAICPETGIWEGWTKDGPTDVLRVEKGRKFDVVRTVSINQSTEPCPMIDGQWMWLCSLEEQGGFVWGGMKLKGLENEC